MAVEAQYFATGNFTGSVLESMAVWLHFPAGFAYKAPSATDPGRGLNGSVGRPARTMRVRLPVFPLSKDFCDAFPGLRGGYAPENIRKGEHATV